MCYLRIHVAFPGQFVDKPTHYDEANCSFFIQIGSGSEMLAKTCVRVLLCPENT